MKPFENQWILITGASKGFGKVLAFEFARVGGNLILTARSTEKLNAVKAQVEELGAECLTVAGDLVDDAVREEVEGLCLEKELDILVNNAGIVRIELLEDHSLENVDRLVAINLTVPIKLTRALIPLFKRRRAGTIVNVNSAGGKKAVDHHTVYCATKYGLNGFADALRLEVKEYGIRVVNVAPGKMATKLFEAAEHPLDMARFIPPEEVAGALVHMLQLSERCCPSDIAIDRMP